MICCLALCFSSVHSHTDIAVLVKSSLYFQGLLPLGAECWDMDGDHTTLPIIFEDVYCEAPVGKTCKYLLELTGAPSVYSPAVIMCCICTPSYVDLETLSAPSFTAHILLHFLSSIQAGSSYISLSISPLYMSSE